MLPVDHDTVQEDHSLRCHDELEEVVPTADVNVQRTEQIPERKYVDLLMIGIMLSDCMLLPGVWVYEHW